MIPHIGLLTYSFRTSGYSTLDVLFIKRSFARPSITNGTMTGNMYAESCGYSKEWTPTPERSCGHHEQSSALYHHGQLILNQYYVSSRQKVYFAIGCCGSNAFGHCWTGRLPTISGSKSGRHICCLGYCLMICADFQCELMCLGVLQSCRPQQWVLNKVVRIWTYLDLPNAIGTAAVPTSHQHNVF